jgi:hypothetical protein
MRKVTMIAVVLMCAAATGFAATINWQTDPTYATGLFTPSGTPAYSANGYIVRMYSSTGAALPAALSSSFNWTTFQPTSGGALLAATAAPADIGIGSGYVYQAAYTDSGLGVGINSYLYTVLWNHATTPTRFCIVDDSMFQIPNYGQTPFFSYNIGGTSSSGTDWVQVPEPGTLALFGLGMLTLGVRRVLRKK